MSIIFSTSSLVRGLFVQVNPTKSIVDFDTTAYAWVGVDSDGGMYSSVTGTAPNVFYETWLDNGLNSQVWVAAVLDGDALTAGSDVTGGTRLACTSDRKWGYTTSGVPRSGDVTLSFYDAASGGNLLDQQTVSMSVETLA
jgi:hypothetical protein